MRLVSSCRTAPAPTPGAAARYAADAAFRLTLPELTDLVTRLEREAARAFAAGDGRAARRTTAVLDAYRAARRTALIRRLHSVGLAVRGRDRRVEHDQARADRIVAHALGRSAASRTVRPLTLLRSGTGEQLPRAPRVPFPPPLVS